jgi:hypothetical protein
LPSEQQQQQKPKPESIIYEEKILLADLLINNLPMIFAALF